ncbi:Uncharacterised protein g6868 [Pycnogonum litorale]
MTFEYFPFLTLMFTVTILYPLSLLKNIICLMSHHVHRPNCTDYISYFIYNIDILYLTINIVQTWMMIFGCDGYLQNILFLRFNFIIYVNLVLIWLFVCTTVSKTLCPDRYAIKFGIVCVITSTVFPICVIHSLVYYDLIDYGNIFTLSYNGDHRVSQKDGYIWHPPFCNIFYLVVYLFWFIMCTFGSFTESFPQSYRQKWKRASRLRRNISSTDSLKDCSDQVELFKCDAEAKMMNTNLSLYMFFQATAIVLSLISEEFRLFSFNIEVTDMYIGVVNILWIDAVYLCLWRIESSFRKEKTFETNV